MECEGAIGQGVRQPQTPARSPYPLRVGGVLVFERLLRLPPSGSCKGNCPREHGAKRRQRFPAACFGSRARTGSGAVRVSSMPRWISTSLIFAKANALAALAVGSNTTEMGLPEGRVEGGSGNPIIPLW